MLKRCFVLAFALVVGFASSASANQFGNVQYGAFYRCCLVAPNGAGSSVAGTSEPSPYPSYTGVPGNPASVNTYCYGPDASGNSIDSAQPNDKTKLANLLDLRTSWVRLDTAPTDIDLDNLFPPSLRNWNSQGVPGGLDAMLCELKLHNVQPVIGIELGGIQYNDSLGCPQSCGAFNNVGHNRFDTPAQFATYCSIMAAHVGGIFDDHLYSIPGNEVNGSAGATDQPGILNGSPPPPVVIASTTAGTLVAATTYNYKVTAIINGVETLPSAAYYSATAASAGHLSMQITWGPSAAETGGYNIYGRTGGSFLKIASVAHGVTTFTDTGAATPSGALPGTSTVTLTGFESDYAAYMQPCYNAIKAADPLAVIYGFELTEASNISTLVTPAKFVSDLRTIYGCGPGTCYDGISTHLEPSFPFPAASTPCAAEFAFAGGTDQGTSCLASLEAAAGRAVPIMIGETGVGVPSVASTEAQAALAVTGLLQGWAAYPYTKYVLYMNIDEDPQYTSGFFLDSGFITSANAKKLRWPAARAIYAPPATPTPAPINADVIQKLKNQQH